MINGDIKGSPISFGRSHLDRLETLRAAEKVIQRERFTTKTAVNQLQTSVSPRRGDVFKLSTSHPSLTEDDSQIRQGESRPRGHAYGHACSGLWCSKALLV